MNKPASFLEILSKYACGDNSRGTDKNITHSYGSIYEHVLSQRRKSVRTMLEIGVYAGASCQVFAEYFDDVIIDGIDISLQYVAFGKNNNKIRMHEIDGTSEAAPKALGGNRYDFIVDDASHLAMNQLKSMEIFAPYLNAGGIYVIEDIQNGYAYLDDFLAVARKHKLLMNWYDLREVKKRYDDVIAVLRTSF